MFWLNSYGSCKPAWMSESVAKRVSHKVIYPVHNSSCVQISPANNNQLIRIDSLHPKTGILPQQKIDYVPSWPITFLQGTTLPHTHITNHVSYFTGNGPGKSEDDAISPGQILSINIRGFLTREVSPEAKWLPFLITSPTHPGQSRTKLFHSWGLNSDRVGRVVFDIFMRVSDLSLLWAKIAQNTLSWCIGNHGNIPPNQKSSDFYLVDWCCCCCRCWYLC